MGRRESSLEGGWQLLSLRGLSWRGLTDEAIEGEEAWLSFEIGLNPVAYLCGVHILCGKIKIF